MCADATVNAALGAKIAARAATFREVSTSPFGVDDEIGMLNLLNDVASDELLRRVTGAPVDLSVDYFIGMPSWQAFGDPAFQIWMTHTPQGNLVDDVIGVGEAQNSLVGYSSDSISMYTHTGTHVDALNHFGYGQSIWNNFSQDKHLGSRYWTKGGADKHPPIITRGILLDVAAHEGTAQLPPSFLITPELLADTAKAQGVAIQPGDVVFIRTGRMQAWPDSDAYIVDEPGIARDGAEWIAKQGAAIIGSDNAAIEVRPSQDPENFHDVHTYLLAEAGVPMLEIADLEGLSAAQMYEFAFIGAALKIRGATGSPIRPLALALA
ncbi:MAG: cyclase family protein [Microbacterium ginsengisoli]|jgi:kynurenine formamidase|uniref:cyclase family protein n=1 Tax=Microbacterium TaxID=33882 RepID=UPI0006F633A6|nr:MULTISPECIES: cyclase family protein [unclassified Microbacterium]KQR94282.1 cyclase [Microbacterium sp. Leaf351]KQS02482.1 cyclase [Microbacterium sp. Leaf347]MBN9199584.1 cyclase family protein [Microbacterium ginsengisoli]OJU76822.1 MAG: cyclase [Microbacterium sp. 71-23]